MKWRDVLLGRTVAMAGTVAIAVLGLDFSDGFGWQERAIFGLGALMVLQSGVAAIRERSGAYRLGQRYMKVWRRALDLMVDLSDLTANNPRPWIVELYLPRYEWRVSRRRPFFRKQTLLREMSATLGVPPVSRPGINVGHELFGKCFRLGGSMLWWDPAVTNGDADCENQFEQLGDATNDGLKQIFGMLGVWALVDDLGHGCEGLLVIHTDRDVERTTTVLGALAHTRARDRVMRAVRDVHGQIQGR